MRKPAFLSNERLSRFLVSILLTMGLLLPLMFTFEAESALALAIASATAVTVLCTALGTLRRGRLVLGIVGGALLAVQLVLPHMGLIGWAMEAFKAVSLYLNGVTAAAPLFARQLGLTLGVTVAGISYLFSSRNVGFLPATILVVLMLFGMWSLCQAEHLWFATPALVALLLLVSQTSHEKSNLFQVLPLAVAVVALAMLLLPSGQTVIQPLYDKAMELRQTISDYLFFTDPRNVFTLGNYGYYPQGNARLGGPTQPSDSPVMTVKTDSRTLLRAISKDEYTGLTWRSTASARRCLYVSPRWQSLRESVFLENMPSDVVRSASTLLDEHAVSIQMQDTATSTLFTPLFLRQFSSQTNLVAYFNDSSELFTTRDLQRGDRYTVFAPILEGGNTQLGALIAAAPKGDDPYYEDICNSCLQLPEHLSGTSDAERMLADVNNITASSATPYEKACAIMRHLQRYYRYTLTPDVPPDSQDFVTYFLYVGKEGYCTYFASAMTVLCRMAGLPARYVEGFVAQPGADGFAYVTGKDAHAWTEVYFEGFGWVPFDATPQQQEMGGDNQQDQQQPEPSPSPSPTPSPQPPEQDQQEEPTPSPDPQPQQDPDVPPPPQDQPPFPWWLVLIVAAVAALVVRIHLRMPAHMAAKATGESDKIFIYGSAVYALLRLMKYKPAPGETPLLFARRLDRQKALPVQVLPLWRIMAMSHYSRVEPGPAESARARDIFTRLYKPQSPVRKLRFMFAAAFGKGVYTGLDTPLVHEEPKPQYDYTFAVTQKKGPKARKKKVKPVRLNKRPKPAGAPKRPSAPAPETRRPSPAESDAPGKPNNAPDQPPVAPARREGERETGAPRRRRSDRRS